MRVQGKVTEWNDPRGFGFISPLEGGERVFVHISAFPVGSRRPGAGELVSYEFGRDEQGRTRALKVTYILERASGGTRKQTSSPSRLVSGIVASTFLGGLTLAAAAGELPWWVLGVYVVASIAAYAAYSEDKHAAGRGGWRTTEAHLLLLGLIGGWPGALFAQHHLRHKNRKVSFQLQYWCTVALNLGLFGWLRTW